MHSKGRQDRGLAALPRQELSCPASPSLASCGSKAAFGQLVPPGQRTPNAAVATDLEYRYRLFPAEKWSPWGERTEATYAFIQPGAYVFQVETRGRGLSLDSPDLGAKRAQFQFVLEQPLITRPISKAGIDRGDKTPEHPNIEIDRLYDRSLALLIGISEYTHFDDFNYQHIENDLSKMKAVCRYQLR